MSHHFCRDNNTMVFTKIFISGDTYAWSRELLKAPFRLLHAQFNLFERQLSRKVAPSTRHKYLAWSFRNAEDIDDLRNI